MDGARGRSRIYKAAHYVKESDYYHCYLCKYLANCATSSHPGACGAGRDEEMGQLATKKLMLLLIIGLEQRKLFKIDVFPDLLIGLTC